MYTYNHERLTLPAVPNHMNCGTGMGSYALCVREICVKRENRQTSIPVPESIFLRTVGKVNLSWL